MMMDAQELLDHDMDGGNHVLSHMHQGKSLVGIYNGVTTQHYSTRSARVVWGL